MICGVREPTNVPLTELQAAFKTNADEKKYNGKNYLFLENIIKLSKILKNSLSEKTNLSLLFFINLFIVSISLSEENSLSGKLQIDQQKQT